MTTAHIVLPQPGANRLACEGVINRRLASRSTRNACLVFVLLGLFWSVIGLVRASPAACETALSNEEPTNPIIVSTYQELLQAVRSANVSGDTTILIADGEYSLYRSLPILADGITIKSLSGNRNNVVLRGQGMRTGPTHVFRVEAHDFTVADMTLGWVIHHVIQVMGEKGADRPLIHNVRVVDSGQQLLKVTAGTGANHRPSVGGIVQWSTFEFSAGVAPQNYTGGIDAHGTKDWIVRHNVFNHIRSPDAGLAEHAIHFWNQAEGTLVESNIIVNADRGIGFGLSNHTHLGGIIRNNMVHTTRDVGIGLENASHAKVYHNSVFTEHYPNSIEYRFPGTNATLIANNLVNKRIKARNGGSARLTGNITDAHQSWFVSPRTGDLHLSSRAAQVIDKGAPVDVFSDIDCETRPIGNGADVGADELSQSGEG